MTDEMSTEKPKRKTKPKGSHSERVKLLGLAEIRKWRRVPVAELVTKLETRGHQATTQSVYNWQNGGSVLQSTAEAIADILEVSLESLRDDPAFILKSQNE
jgi:hypothetical protein